MRIKQILFKYLILTLMFFVMAACTSDVKEATCGSQEDFNPVFRQCVPKSLNGSIEIESSSPVLSYSVSRTSTLPVSHSINVIDPFSQGYQTQWFLYRAGQPTQVLDNGTDNISFDPSAQVAGTYSMEAIVKDLDNVRVLDKVTWTIVITDNNAPEITNQIPVPTVVNIQTSDPIQTFQADIDNSSNEIGYSYQFILNGVIVGGNTIGNGIQNASYAYNPALIVTPGSQTLSLAVKSPANITEQIFTWTIIVTNPDLPKFSFQEVPNAATVTVIDGITIGADGFIYNNNPVSFCLQTDDFDGTQNNGSSGTELRFFIANTTTGAKVPINSPGTPFPANNINLCLRNILGSYKIDLTNPQVSETKNIIAELYDIQTGELSDTRDWQVVIRPKNTPPVITAVSPLNSSIVTIEQDAIQNYLFDVFDLDSSNPDDFETEFFLNGVSVCSHPRLSGQTAPLKFSCDVAIPSYGTTGPVAPTSSNTLIAVTRDTAVAAWGGANLESNQLAWNITTTEAQTAPSVLPSPASYIASPFLPGVPLVSVDESTTVQFHVVIQDAERDDLLVTLQRCNAPTGACVDMIVDDVLNKTNDDINSTWIKNVYLDQNTLIGAASGDIYFNIIAKDVPHTVASDSDDLTTPVAERLSITVNNVNPVPVITGSSIPDHVTSNTRVVTGLPASFDPGAVTDDSEADGDVIEYRWRISNNSLGPFTDISGAEGSTNRVLAWTPPANIAGTTHYLRVCIGDNGFGNATADCTLNRTWTVTPVSNLVTHNGANAGTAAGETASWFDSTSNSLYTVYSSGFAPSVELSLVQTLYNPDGTTLESSILIPSGDVLIPGSLSYEVADLSIVGEVSNPLRRSLYISYIEKVAAPVAGTNDYLRIRRVDITEDGRLGFSYDGLIIDDPDANCFSKSYNAVFNRTRLSILDTCDYGDAIEINGVPFELVASVGAPVATGVNRVVVGLPDTGINVAIALDTVVDGQNSDPRLASTTSPDIVILDGASVVIDHDDLFRDVNEGLVSGSRILTKAGDIMIHNPGSPTWLVPVLDVATSSKILFVTSMADGSSIASETINLFPTTGTEEATEIANKYNPVRQRVDVAIKSNAGPIYAYSFNAGVPSFPLGRISDLFSSSSINNIKIGSEKTNNPYVFITGQDVSAASDPLVLARIAGDTFAAAVGPCPSGCILESPLDDNGTGLGTSVADYQLNSSTQNEEAVLAIISNSDSKAYIAKVSGSTPALTSSMAPVLVAADTANLGANFKVSATDLINNDNDNTGITLGDAGLIPGQNTVNGFFFSYFKTSSATDPETAFININNEVNIGQSIDANDETIGYMLPYIQ